MSEWTGTVVAKSENGIKVVDKGAWLNWSLPDYRGTPFDSDVKAGDRVRIEYAEVVKDGNKRTYISVIENLSRPTTDNPFPPDEGFPGDEAGTPFPSGPAPESPENGSDQQDGQFRSPKDFRRTSALAQAVAYHGPDGRQDIDADREDVILTAQRFEEYLGTGK
ncbi:hypothetical protein LCGC14_1839130 [marine sediment metagenome]|uniref:Uncharacterized protein n=1 Tax=marine sediment metagenome TaxID=412755 RepID=A0A0F9H1Y1_9ZZZZ